MSQRRKRLRVHSAYIRLVNTSAMRVTWRFDDWQYVHASCRFWARLDDVWRRLLHRLSWVALPDLPDTILCEACGCLHGARPCDGIPF